MLRSSIVLVAIPVIIILPPTPPLQLLPQLRNSARQPLVPASTNTASHGIRRKLRAAFRTPHRSYGGHKHRLWQNKAVRLQGLQQWLGRAPTSGAAARRSCGPPASGCRRPPTGIRQTVAAGAVGGHANYSACPRRRVIRVLAPARSLHDRAGKSQQQGPTRMVKPKFHSKLSTSVQYITPRRS